MFAEKIKMLSGLAFVPPLVVENVHDKFMNNQFCNIDDDDILNEFLLSLNVWMNLLFASIGEMHDKMVVFRKNDIMFLIRYKITCIEPTIILKTGIELSMKLKWNSVASHCGYKEKTFGKRSYLSTNINGNPRATQEKSISRFQ